MNIGHKLEIELNDAFSTIRFFGYVDAATTEDARGVIAAKIPENSGNIVIDLAQVEFLDSHGVGLFVSLLKKAHKNGGRLFIISAEGQPASVLNIVGFNNTLVTYCENMQQAKGLITGRR